MREKLKMTPLELNNFLDKHGLDKFEFAELLGVTGPALDHWFKGRRDIPQTTIRVIRLFDKQPELMAVF